MSKSLEEIRQKIDSLDDKIHDLLMERADLIVDVSAAKKKTGTQIVQPAREAIMIRRLLKRHRGPLPEIVIVRIWRELVGAVSLLQTGLKVSVTTNDVNGYCWDMAKEYFGSVLPMHKAGSPLTAVSSVHEDAASFAVLPWPQDGEQGAWWPYLINRDDKNMKVICALPYDFSNLEKSRQQGRSLVVAKTHFLPSGDDNSFLGFEIDPAVSRTRIVDALKSIDLEAISLNSVSGREGGHSLHMAEVKGYVGAEDALIEKLAGKFDGLHAKIRSLGGYPVPPVFKGNSQVEPITNKPSEPKQTVKK